MSIKSIHIAILIVIAAGSVAFVAEDVAAQVVFRDSLFAVERIEGIVYGTAEILNPPSDFELLLDLYRPIGTGTPVLRPGYVIIHGGGFYTGSRNELKWRKMATQMAARGYVAVSIDYRLQGQFPVPSDEFQALRQEIGNATHAAAIEDGTNAYRWLVANAEEYRIDPNRIAAGGSSAGSTIAMAMAWVVDDFAITVEPPVPVVADFYGTIGDFRQNMECGEAPFVIFHGTEDNIVPIDEAYHLMAQADSCCAEVDTLGINYEFYPVEGAGHGGFDYFTTEASPDTTIFEKMVYFFYDNFNPPLPVAVTEQIPLATIPVLRPNYPNPFNPQTNISFSLPRAAWAEVGVYDLAGRQVSVLASREFTAGVHALSWDGQDATGYAMPSGTYLVRLETASGVEARKVMLVR